MPPDIVTAHPDIKKIRRMVKQAIAKADGSATAKTGTGFARKNDKASTGGSIGNIHDGYAANSADRPQQGLLNGPISSGGTAGPGQPSDGVGGRLAEEPDRKSDRAEAAQREHRRGLEACREQHGVSGVRRHG